MKHRMRITETSVDEFHAIAHMIGQWHDMDVEAVPTAFIEKFIGVSRPTAIKHLNRMVELGYLECSEIAWRPNAKQYKWRLSPDARMKYRKGEFADRFNFVKSLILQVAKMSGQGKVTI